MKSSIVLIVVIAVLLVLHDLSPHTEAGHWTLATQARLIMDAMTEDAKVVTGDIEDSSTEADGVMDVTDAWIPSTEEEKMLTITSEQDASWWHSCYHNTTAMVGAGVLSLPSTFATLLWPGGLITLILATVISLYTILQLAWMHEEVDKKTGKVVRLNRYHQLTQYAFGKKKGLLMLLPFQLMVCVGAAITYTITGGMSLRRIWLLTCPGAVDPKTGAHTCNTPFSLSAWIVIYSAAEAVLSQVPNFTKLGAVSAVGAVASLTYSTLAYALSFKAGKQPDASYGPIDHGSSTVAVFSAFNAIANIAFAFGGHNMALEIQSTIPRKPPSNSSVPQMKLGIYVAYAITTYCYFMVSVSGYWAFGNQVAGNVLMSFNAQGTNLAANLVAQLSVILHVLASYQVFSFVVYDMIEQILVRRGIKPTVPVRLAYRTLYVIVCAFVACLLPFFGDIMGLVGALGTTPTSYTIPSIVWLKLKKPAAFSVHWIACWVTIVLSVMVGVFGTVGSIYVLALNAASYGVFQ